MIKHMVPTPRLPMAIDISKYSHYVIKVTHIATRFYHTLAATADGRLFEWGRNPQEIKMKMFVQRRLRNAHEKAGDGAEKVGFVLC